MERTNMTIKSDSEDFLTARRLPLPLREYIVAYGGVEEYRNNIWEKTLAKNYIIHILKGMSAIRALKYAKQECSDEFLDNAFNAGYIERLPRQQEHVSSINSKCLTIASSKQPATAINNKPMKMFTDVSTFSGRRSYSATCTFIPSSLEDEVTRVRMFIYPYIKLMPILKLKSINHQFPATYVDFLARKSSEGAIIEIKDLTYNFNKPTNIPPISARVLNYHKTNRLAATSTLKPTTSSAPNANIFSIHSEQNLPGFFSNQTSDSEDFLTARRLPLPLREYIVAYGGVEEYRTNIWEKTLAKNYMIHVLKGMSAIRALKYAKQACSDEFLDNAFNAGYIERLPRQQEHVSSINSKCLTIASSKQPATVIDNKPMNMFTDVSTFSGRRSYLSTCTFVPSSFEDEVTRVRMFIYPYIKLMPILKQLKSINHQFPATYVDFLARKSSEAAIIEIKDLIYNFNKPTNIPPISARVLNYHKTNRLAATSTLKPTTSSAPNANIFSIHSEQNLPGFFSNQTISNTITIPIAKQIDEDNAFQDTDTDMKNDDDTSEEHNEGDSSEKSHKKKGLLSRIATRIRRLFICGSKSQEVDMG